MCGIVIRLGLGVCVVAIATGCPTRIQSYDRRGEEICDGYDNDEDSKVDEDDPRNGEPCGDRPDASSASCSGTRQVLRCRYGKEMACTTESGPSFETCNQDDDDCDGFVDEGNVCDPVFPPDGGV